LLADILLSLTLALVKNDMQTASAVMMVAVGVFAMQVGEAFPTAMSFLMIPRVSKKVSFSRTQSKSFCCKTYVVMMLFVIEVCVRYNDGSRSKEANDDVSNLMTDV